MVSDCLFPVFLVNLRVSSLSIIQYSKNIPAHRYLNYIVYGKTKQIIMDEVLRFVIKNDTLRKKEYETYKSTNFQYSGYWFVPIKHIRIEKKKNNYKK
jgi:hypothetical protein